MSLWVYIFIALMIWNLTTVLGQRETGTPVLNVPYSVFWQQLSGHNVAEVSFQGSVITGKLKQAITYPAAAVAPSSAGTATPQGAPSPAATPVSQTSDSFQSQLPDFGDPALMPLLKDEGVKITAAPAAATPLWMALLINIAPWVLLIGAFVFLSRRASQGQQSVFGFGKSRAKRYVGSEARITFADVAGVDEAKADLQDIIDFLCHPERYQKLGGRIPRGVLLVGPSGTGKTLLARATAGEANVPFFSISGSEFVEMLVGVGASRVRDLFDQAKKLEGPSIIFIDEIDAIGRRRGAGVFTGGNEEREQALNQILVEMDGFEANSTVVVLAATNRADILDPALLRAGRFDRQVTVDPPERAGREAILRVHCHGVPLAMDADLAAIARATAGMVGADLANLVNEAALLAAKRSKTAVDQQCFVDALSKIQLGAVRPLALSPEERRIIAYHEAGHALVALLLPLADPLNRVTIVPRGHALGVTLQLPIDDRHSYSKQYLLTRIAVALAGRLSEELVFGDVTTGAENDLELATVVVRQMVTRWGMSEALGLLTETAATDGVPPGFLEQRHSEFLGRQIDHAMQDIVSERESFTRELLVTNRTKLDHLAALLLEHESLDAETIRQALGEVEAEHQLPASPDAGVEDVAQAATSSGAAVV